MQALIGDAKMELLAIDKDDNYSLKENNALDHIPIKCRTQLNS